MSRISKRRARKRLARWHPKMVEVMTGWFLSKRAARKLTWENQATVLPKRWTWKDYGVVTYEP